MVIGIFYNVQVFHEKGGGGGLLVLAGCIVMEKL